MRQPALFDFREVNADRVRKSGLTVAEERDLRIFALSDNYPRTHLIERTGTVYTVKTPFGARRLMSALGFGKVMAKDLIRTDMPLSFSFKEMA